MMREQIHQILRAPVGRPRLGRRRGFSGRAPRSPPAGPHGRRGGRCRDDGTAACRTPRAGSEANDLAARLGPLVSPDSCIAPERILVSSPRHCAGHGWMARVRLEGSRRPQIVPGRMMMYSPDHGRVTYTHDDLAADDSPYRFVLASSEYSPVVPSLNHTPEPSPEYSPETPPHSPTLLHTPTPDIEPPLDFPIRRTRAARCGALPFYDNAGEGSSSAVLAAPSGFEAELAPPPPPPPATWFPGRPTAVAAANARPGLNRHRLISTGHIPTGRNNPCLVISPEKHRWGKHEIWHVLALNIVSLKTLHEKNLMGKTHKRKERNV
ncbi:unnamed protein product [Urochloa humidicola]